MISVIRAVLFLISNLGFWEFYRRQTNIHVTFLPSLTIASQTVILFLAGLLNVLGEMTIILWVTGLILLLIYAIKDRNVFFLKSYIHVGYIFMAVTILLMAFYLRGKIFSHYDDFSHWAMAVKYLLKYDSYPNFKDSLIYFQSYPLGSSTYIYYFTKSIRESEPVMMLAQVYMMTTALMPLFIFADNNKLPSLLTGFCFMVLFFNYNILTTELLVDTLLPIVSMCVLFYIYKYCGAGSRKESFYLAAAYLIQIIQIKNSGIFFVIVCVICLMIQAKSSGSLFKRIVLSAVPFLSLYIWNRHCDYVFIDASSSKHSMNIEYFKAVMNRKTPEEIQQILKVFANYIFRLRDIWMILAVLLMVGLFTFLFFKNELHIWKKLMLISLVMFIFYEIGLAGMYIFSMEGEEAESLAGCLRYTKTILIAIIYLISLFLMNIIGKNETGRWTSAAVFLFSALLIGMVIRGSNSGVRIFKEDQGEHYTVRKWMEKSKSDFAVPEEESYCILMNDYDSGFSEFLGRYVFWSSQVETRFITEQSDFIDLSERYILIYNLENPLVQDWLDENYPAQKENAVIFRW